MKSNNQMYITGSQYDLEIRLHEFAQNTGDLTNYALEGSSYILSNDIKNKLNREYIKKSLSFNTVVTGNNF